MMLHAHAAISTGESDDDDGEWRVHDDAAQNAKWTSSHCQAINPDSLNLLTARAMMLLSAMRFACAPADSWPRRRSAVALGADGGARSRSNEPATAPVRRERAPTAAHIATTPIMDAHVAATRWRRGAGSSPTVT